MPTQPMVPGSSRRTAVAPDWMRAVVDPAAFSREQEILAQTWTFLGLRADVAKDGAWFRASLATRPVFVQRFDDDIRGFENRCTHRGSPLRNTDKGSGPIVCDYHHWQYDREGCAVGIPKCRELFGATPRELGFKLAPLEIATCGSFIFGRFPGPLASETLEQFLGDGYACLEQMSKSGDSAGYQTYPTKANWRLCFHNTLDDYHTVAVHPHSWGRAGYPERGSMGYFRFGAHSAMLMTPDSDALAKMVSACRDGTYRSEYYSIFQIFPNTLVLHFRSDAQFWQILIQQFVPLTHDRSVSLPQTPSTGVRGGIE